MAVTAITLLLIVPMVLMAPDETAPDSAGGPVYDLEDSFSSRLPSRFHGSFFMIIIDTVRYLASSFHIGA